MLAAARGYLAPLQREGIDTLVLGCTHYPMLSGLIARIMGPDVLLLSSAEETANDVYELLAVKDLLAGTKAPPTHRFETSGDREWFATLGARFLGPEVRSADRVVLDPAGSR